MDPAVAKDPPAIWAQATSSPGAPADPPRDALEREALARCGPAEAGLSEAARQVAARAVQGLPLPDADALAFAQRVAGEPHPWARAWAASARALPIAGKPLDGPTEGKPLDGPTEGEPLDGLSDTTLRRLDDWLLQDHEPRLRRCAVASGVAADGTRTLAIVAVDALADLASVPVRGRTGQWLTVEARLHVQAAGGEILVLGPSGAPRRVPAWFDGTTLRARFALDRPGEFTVQVLASTASGPRPVAEARVFADVEPPAHASTEHVPGEDAGNAPASDGTPARPDADALAAMLSAARESAGEPPLTRDARLDALARAHAEHMVASQTLAHDAGDGDPVERARAAGLATRTLGENVAHAASVALAHRALWASPSHRANMLRRDFDRVGVAVVRDDHGDAWAVEAFAARLR
jgi:uncharacterized protein YkwD